jgi:prepilin-type N-terminal cleavage/methylation domain-containing protein
MHERGFTMVEVLVVMTISAILLALAIPSFERLLRTNRVSSATNSMLAAMDLARSEAVRRSGVVTVCRSTNADAPNPACSSAAAGGYADNDWASGWIVFAKAPANVVNLGTVEANDELLLRQTPFQAMAQQRLIMESTLANNQWRAYGPRGLNAGGAIGITLFIDVRDTAVAVRSDMARCLVANITGRPRVARVVADACPAA